MKIPHEQRMQMSDEECEVLGWNNQKATFSLSVEWIWRSATRRLHCKSSLFPTMLPSYQIHTHLTQEWYIAEWICSSCHREADTAFISVTCPHMQWPNAEKSPTFHPQKVPPSDQGGIEELSVHGWNMRIYSLHDFLKDSRGLLLTHPSASLVL